MLKRTTKTYYFVRFYDLCNFRRAHKVRELEFPLGKTQDLEHRLRKKRFDFSRKHVFPLGNSTSEQFQEIEKS